MPGSESKQEQEQQEPREQDVHFSEQVLRGAIAFCASPAFRAPVLAFQRAHLHLFQQYCQSHYDCHYDNDCKSDCKSQEVEVDAEDVEQSLECGEVFAEFQELVESLLEDFAARHGSSAQEFFRECSDAVEGKFVPLFEEHENKW